MGCACCRTVPDPDAGERDCKCLALRTYAVLFYNLPDPTALYSTLHTIPCHAIPYCIIMYYTTILSQYIVLSSVFELQDSKGIGTRRV